MSAAAQQYQQLLPEEILKWIYRVLQPEYKDPVTSYQDICSILVRFKSIRPRTKVYTNELGRSQLLFNFYGTVSSLQNNYQIPVEVWLPFEYPLNPPIAYVVLPAHSNLVLRPNSYVDANGQFQHPFLNYEWTRMDHNHDKLLKLFNIMCECFDHECPVYYKIINTNNSTESSNTPVEIPSPPALPNKVGLNGTTLQANHLQRKIESPVAAQFQHLQISRQGTGDSSNDGSMVNHHNYRTISTPVDSSSSTIYHNIQSPPPLPEKPQQYVSSTSNNRITEQISSSASAIQSRSPPASVGNNFIIASNRSSPGVQQRTPINKPVYRENDQFSLMDQDINSSKSPMLPTNPSRLEVLNSLQGNLKTISSRELKGNIQTLVNNKLYEYEEKLRILNQDFNETVNMQDYYTSVIQKNNEILDDKLSQIKKLNNELALKSKEEINVDNLTATPTVKHEQLYDLITEDMAITDTIQKLSELYESEKIGLNQHMKFTRNLARDQFMIRALSKKIVADLGLQE
ncbi:hypothetical protein PACTADRAFT_35802 [Pachysolen tannophilus NRRL Y-2460]|uniref:UEV domain-containing protein n=1 Tax=Pachysolen tannophilus NRRL Y-2460 TaxID=669874 RepID=A0A1E4TN65_PACTA|nr:hypothetical protein PACTADRAFT_35802 [Pachysolen tannophilus NRRL Y-2460]